MILGMIGKLFLWHDFLKNRELGELLGNPKGTKSFSSWSEFTDFVNEMPIKTIQPFVSNFNAFAGEGFYGNVVQGLVIKQLEDAVFIFGIAIDGTLIFRKRNYPDVSTWEDPKIIIHSNNWHKIYFVTDLGGLLEINKIINGFTSESFSLHKGESKRIKANGILVICSQYYNLYPSIAVISPATKNIEYIGGYKEYIDGTLFTFTFENDYTTIMTSKIEGVEGSRVPFLIAYQNLLP